MKLKVSFITFIFLVMIIIAEFFIYMKLWNNIIPVKAMYDMGKFELNNDLTKYVVKNNEITSFGYGDILDILADDSRCSITSIKRDDMWKDALFVQIEFNAEENEFEEILKQIYSMKNLNQIHNISIKDNKLLKKSVIINGEFKIN